jgi:hypothetical protein
MTAFGIENRDKNTEYADITSLATEAEIFMLTTILS